MENYPEPVISDDGEEVDDEWLDAQMEAIQKAERDADQYRDTVIR